MLPLFLSIEGLYSYQAKQEVDFTKLTEAGLFGIFGSVGSGKSSILEAIGFALYGNTERLNSKENRSYNMLNLKSDSATIIFDFLNFENRKFRFTVHWRRRKKFDQTSTIERVAYEWENGSWTPLESVDASAITNLTYQNFKRTIIIPQGQFKEFLDLKGKDRSDMMKEIFNLDKYDLGPKVSTLQIENNRKIENLQGVLSGFEGITTDVLQLKKINLQEEHSLLRQKKDQYQHLEHQYRLLTEAKSNRQNLVEKQQLFGNLSSRKADIDRLEKELDEYENFVTLFKDTIQQIDVLQKEQAQQEVKIQNLLVDKQQTAASLKEKELAYEKIHIAYQAIDIQKTRITDLKNLIQINLQQDEKSTLTTRLAKGTPILEQTKAEELVLKEDIEEQEQLLEQLKSVKIDTSELIEIDNWYRQYDVLLRDQTTCIANISNLKLQQEELTTAFKKNRYSLEKWESELAIQNQSVNTELDELNRQETALEVQRELSRFVDNLQNDYPCPLCGSLEHPAPMHLQDVGQQITDILATKATLKKQLEHLATFSKQMTQWSTSYLERKARLETATKELQSLNLALADHKNQFSWEDFKWDNRESFEKKKATVRQSEIQIKEVELLIKSLRVQLGESQQKISKFEKTLNDFARQIAVIQGIIAQHSAQIQILDVQQYKERPTPTLENEIQSLEEHIRSITNQQQELQTSLHQLQTQLAALNGKHSESLENYQKIITSIDDLNGILIERIESHHAPGMAAIQIVLHKNLPIQDNRRAIKEFHIEYETLQKQIHELEQACINQVFNEHMYDETAANLENTKLDLEQQIAKYGALEQELRRLEDEFAKKGKLLEQYEQLNQRKNNLRTLDNMFKGSGFVNYVSSIHLQRLCDIANQRFHRLTKNQLSLIINEANEFEVIDYLNNGYHRSVKTLSGGQGFQASLCLALALAENIQSLNKADKNFFFIDEGFGTQDAESMNTVFETLQYLNKENRIVGIISHVEELKERIPISITVVKDLEKGSILKLSS
ncbi:SbcC/MukB-like Walker B domain-containing protein [Sphingobacterium sp. SYP-B4668]|uniref:SbcC/MukB-like Walker B domain-containing protein n=1 Tax=Sphingobacterium sp. SYP-B4668 TaxID=2996035 RepID=UPI0022DE3ED5|nr:SbcC/MukB-like Walker B domain-containing protein [Sphingobacterium sp. SYP-B4668]